MLNEEDAYPPHFTIEVLGTAATESDVLLVTLSGADRELELQKPLEVTGMHSIFLKPCLRFQNLNSLLRWTLPSGIMLFCPL